MTMGARRARLAPVVLALACLPALVACGAAPVATADLVAPETPAATPSGDDPTPVPNPGVTDAPAGALPGDGGVLPGDGDVLPGMEPTIVTPVAGATNLHDVIATGVEATTDGDRVVARVSWWSGIAPCTVLAGIVVDADPDGFHYTLTVREGSAAAPDTACTEQAVYKAAVVDLAAAVPGNTYIVTATGAPDSVTLVLD